MTRQRGRAGFSRLAMPLRQTTTWRMTEQPADTALQARSAMR